MLIKNETKGSKRTKMIFTRNKKLNGVSDIDVWTRVEHSKNQGS